MKTPRVLIDSGAYTAYRQGITIDIDKYAQFVIEHGHEFDGCINLDHINDTKKSYENWKYLKSLGAHTIPVYHMVTGEEEYLKKYLDETDHIAIGAVANLDTEQRVQGFDVIWKKYFLDKDNMPKVKIHGLGLTQIDQMLKYPWFSVDSFTPVISAVWGSILLPIIRDGQFKYFDMFICRVSDQAKHVVGNETSFLGLPPSAQKAYEGLITEAEFELGELRYQEQRPTRKDKKNPKKELKPEFGYIIKPADTEVRTLANHWEERMRWNLTMWTRLQRRTPVYPRPYVENLIKKEEMIQGPKTIMYMGVSTTTHLAIFGKVRPKLDILISYAYWSENIAKAVAKYRK